MFKVKGLGLGLVLLVLLGSYSCVSRNSQLRHEKNIELVKKYVYDEKEQLSIGFLFYVISDKNVYYSTPVFGNSVYCHMNVSYIEPQTYYSVSARYIVKFGIDIKTNKVTILYIEEELYKKWIAPLSSNYEYEFSKNTYSKPKEIKKIMKRFGHDIFVFK